MKNLTRRAFTALLALCLVLALVPVSVFADPVDPPSFVYFYSGEFPETYPGAGNAGYRTVYDNEFLYNNGDGDGMLAGDDYNFGYEIDGSVGRIYLNDYDGGLIFQDDVSCGQIEIVLEGDNRITETGYRGIFLLDADIVFRGSGSLTINVTPTNNNYARGIATGYGSGSGSVTLRDDVDVTINVTSQTVTAFGIDTASGLTIQDHACLTINAVSNGLTWESDATAVRLFGQTSALNISTDRAMVWTADCPNNTANNGYGDGYAISANYGGGLTFSMTNCPSLTLRGRNYCSSCESLAYPDSIYETPPDGYMATLTNMENDIALYGAATQAVISPDTRIAIDLPEPVSLAYNGTVQCAVPESDSYDREYGLTAIRAGNYYTDVTPKPGYKWSDNGLADTRRIYWTISKAVPTAEFFNYPAMEAVYDGWELGFASYDISLKNTYSYAGGISDLRFGTLGSGVRPRDAGDYPTVVHVGGGDNFLEGDMELGVYRILKAPNTFRKAGDTEYFLKVDSGNVDFRQNIYNPQGDVSWSITQPLAGCSVSSDGVFTVGSTAGECVLTATAEGNDNYESGSVSWLIHVTDKNVAGLDVTIPGFIEYSDPVPDPSYQEPAGTVSTSIFYESPASSLYPKSEDKPTEVAYYCVTVVCETPETVFIGRDYFYIDYKSIANAVINFGTQAVYDGTLHDAVIESVTLGGTPLVQDVDYYISSGGNAIEVHDTQLRIVGKGNYGGLVTALWTLRKAVPTAADLDLYELSPHSYDGSPRVISAPSPAPGKSGLGERTVLYNGSPEAPTNAGTYNITVDVSEGQNYLAASGIPWGTLTINKSPDPMQTLEASVIVFNSADLTRSISGNAGALSFEIIGNDHGCSVSPEGIFTAGSSSGDVHVNVTAAESANHVSVTRTLVVNVRPYPSPNFQVDGDTVTWNASFPNSGEPVLIMAVWYDENDRMLGITAQTSVLNGPTPSGCTIPVAAGAHHYRLMFAGGAAFTPFMQSFTAYMD